MIVIRLSKCYLRAIRALAIVAGVSCSWTAMAACTDDQAEAKVTQLMDALTQLMTRNPRLTETLSTEARPLITEPVTEQTCITYDRLIARARAGR